jgi:hypothetical protein
MDLPVSQRRVLEAMAQGDLLKSHRDLDGHKVYRLYPPNGTPTPIDPEIVEQLVDTGLIDSNKKFPAATYWLTAKARSLLDAEPRGVHATSTSADKT